ncbi:hypothetical protein D3C87_278960 [compost metagenome]
MSLSPIILSGVKEEQVTIKVSPRELAARSKDLVSNIYKWSSYFYIQDNKVFRTVGVDTYPHPEDTFVRMASREDHEANDIMQALLKLERKVF